eukprot:CAMPEP_0206040892 /NCGR_PEP_ID=MMETSP1466-20131121/5646_1 /ASSEMBLY_ACC=CAM_ASM_001126 /TAXON_ID=44452 /ORGANISM="Pavlova gyrans, Strain CCMP608" /LENGTH=224 /DNA_ID=CAMNT_0053415575 /DNA_START=162 /DNA_END=832 /DNA_ORIENTATION=-
MQAVQLLCVTLAIPHVSVDVARNVDQQTSCTLANVTGALHPGSEALAKYLDFVYGPAPSTVISTLRAHDFAGRLETSVELLWEAALPSALTHGCTWPKQPTGPDSVYRTRQQNWPPGALAIYRHPIAECPASGPQLGSRRRATRLRALAMPEPFAQDPRFTRYGEWVEVTHTFSWDLVESAGFWMYRAVGSGLWYRMGHALHLRDKQTMAEAAGVGVRHFNPLP